MEVSNNPAETISLTALKSGDRDAFARLVDATYDRIYRLALRITGDSHDAEDVLQEAYIKALRGLPEFEGRSSVITWLYRIATNEALMLVRKRRPELGVMDDDPGDNANENSPLPHPVQIVDWCCLPEPTLLSTETRQVMDRAVDGLSEALRVVFLLRDVQGLSVRETAEVLNVSEEVVKTRLLRARLKLREDLSGYFSEHMVEKPAP